MATPQRAESNTAAMNKAQKRRGAKRKALRSALKEREGARGNGGAGARQCQVRRPGEEADNWRSRVVLDSLFGGRLRDETTKRRQALEEVPRDMGWGVGEEEKSGS